jgi:hypothetical protein
MRLPVVSSVRVITQAVIRRTLADVKARLRSHASLYGFCGEKLAVGEVCLRVVLLFPVSVVPRCPSSVDSPIAYDV